MKEKNRINFRVLTLTMYLVFSVLQVNAQNTIVIADYPLIENLIDVTGNNGDILLEGNPVTPTPPSIGVELCQNGIYIISTNGQNIQTPVPTGFDLDHFEVEVDFKVVATPNNAFNYAGIIMGGKFSRFIGVNINEQNEIGIKYNNSNVIFSNSSVILNTYYNARLRYNSGNTQLFLDNVEILNESLPSLVDFQNGHEFTTTDFNNGTSFEGCIRNLAISNLDIDEIFNNGFED